MNVVDLNKVMDKLGEVLEEAAANGFKDFTGLAPLRKAIECTHPDLPFVPDDILTEIGHMMQEAMLEGLPDTVRIIHSQQTVNADAMAAAAIAKAKAGLH